MKRLSALALLLLASACVHAQTVTNSTVGSWTAPTLNTDSTPITVALTYNIYAGPKGGAFTKVASAVSGTSATITLPAGATCLTVTAVEGTQESPPSNTACVIQPAAPGGAAITITVKIS